MNENELQQRSAPVVLWYFILMKTCKQRYNGELLDKGLRVRDCAAARFIAVCSSLS